MHDSSQEAARVEAFVEELRRAALEAAQGVDGAGRVFVVESGIAEALAAALAEDGGRAVIASANGRASLDGARALVRGLEGSASRTLRVESAARLVRRTLSALEGAEVPTAVVLNDAGRADEATARWWWSLARRMRASAGSAAAPIPAILVAVTREEPLPASPWRALDEKLGLRIGVRRLERTGNDGDCGLDLARPDEHDPEVDAGRGARAARSPRRARVSPSRTARALTRAIALVLRGDLARAAEAAAEADLAAADDDDLASDAAAELAAAAVAIGAGMDDALARLEGAAVAVALADDAALRATVTVLRAVHFGLEGDLAVSIAAAEDAATDGAAIAPRAREILVAMRARARTLAGGPSSPSPWQAAARRSRDDAGPAMRGLDVWNAAVEAAGRGDGHARAKLMSAAAALEHAHMPLFAGRAWLDAASVAGAAGLDAESAAHTREARRCWERAGCRARVAQLDHARVEGLSAPGRAVASGGAPETLDSIRALASAETAEAVVTIALEAASRMIPARGGAAMLGAGSSVRTVALRGRTNLFPPFAEAHGPRLHAVVRSARTGIERGRLALDRGTADPAFSRDERRLLESIAGLAGAALDRAELAPARARKRGAEAGASGDTLPPLDDRMSIVERATLVDALARHDGNLSRTAKALGLSRNGLKMKLARHGLRDA